MMASTSNSSTAKEEIFEISLSKLCCSGKTAEEEMIRKQQQNAKGVEMETHLDIKARLSMSELLEDSGNCRQMRDQELRLHRLNASLFKEQQKLRQVLDWAQTFLSRGSEVHSEFCRAESLVLAEEEEIKSPGCKQLPAATYHHTEPSCLDELHVSLSVSSEEESIEHLDTTDRHNLSREDGTMLASDGATCLIKKPTYSYNKTLNPDYNMVKEKQSQQVKLSKDKSDGKVGSKKEEKEAVGMIQREERTNKRQKYGKEHEEETSVFSGMKIPPSLTVYEQYQVCVDQLQHLKTSKHTELGRCIKSCARERKTSAQTANPDTLKLLNETFIRRVTTAEKERRVNVSNEPKYRQKKETVTEHLQAKHCDICHKKYDKSMEGRIAEGNTFINYLINTYEDLKETGEDDDAAAKEEHAGLFPKRRGRNVGGKLLHRGLKETKKTAEAQGALLGLCNKSRTTLSSLTRKDTSQRPGSSQEKRLAKRLITEDQRKATSACKDAHKSLLHTEMHYDDPQPAAVAAWTDEQTRPAGVAVRLWLCLPDEVWLSVLALLPLSDLCRAMQVCRRLRILAADRTLWRNVRIENLTLTDQWLFCVGRHRPRSLSLYSCSGPSLSSCGMEAFFSLCRNSLEELQITSCMGPGLHGDQILSLIGQLCDLVTSVDVSWSGATDVGVKALSDCRPGLKLNAVVLNGGQVTDDPLIKLIMRHRESLCRLEVFGCHFLTSSCLQTVFETCPGLQHLNIGQVPKVNTDCLTVMTSQLKSLISLNLTGLRAVSEALVDALLQSCVKLQSLTLSSCTAVTDLTLQKISKYTPRIRELDVSGCKAVTGAGVESLALGCHRLQQLDLSSTHTGNRGVALLANYCSRHLQTVKLSFCHISRESVLKLCRHCTRLKVLHLYGCTRRPTDGDIQNVNSAVKVYPSD